MLLCRNNNNNNNNNSNKVFPAEHIARNDVKLYGFAYTSKNNLRVLYLPYFPPCKFQEYCISIMCLLYLYKITFLPVTFLKSSKQLLSIKL